MEYQLVNPSFAVKQTKIYDCFYITIKMGKFYHCAMRSYFTYESSYFEFSIFKKNKMKG